MTCRVDPPSFGINYGSFSFSQLSGYICVMYFTYVPSPAAGRAPAAAATAAQIENFCENVWRNLLLAETIPKCRYCRLDKFNVKSVCG